jgi:hypothetical protein
MENKTLFNLIIEALEEAYILENAREKYDNDNFLLTAMRLSGAPYSFVKLVAEKNFKNGKAVTVK